MYLPSYRCLGRLEFHPGRPERGTAPSHLEFALPGPDLPGLLDRLALQAPEARGSTALAWLAD